MAAVGDGDEPVAISVHDDDGRDDGVAGKRPRLALHEDHALLQRAGGDPLYDPAARPGVRGGGPSPRARGLRQWLARPYEIIRQFAAQGLPVVYHRVERNEGYGNGILQSIPVCSAPWIGIIAADGQVDAEDAARLFDVVKYTDGRVIGKVRRRFRMDGVKRKIVSVLYNGFVFLLWPGHGSIDVNGLPKIVHRDVLAAMDLQSKNWFFDPELMIKAHYLGVRVLEMNVFARMRSNGLSHVRPSAASSSS